MKSTLSIAGCQFSIEADVAHNLDCIRAQIAEAAERGARVVHFPEAAISGYAGVDIESTSVLDWDLLRRATEEVCRTAAKHKVWVLLGSTHRLAGEGLLPHNSVYVIDDAGRIVDRYDKRFCTGWLEPAPERDLAFYSPGDHAVVFDVDGFRCGVLICYDYRFPELYRDLKRRGVEIVFQSFHNARRNEEEHRMGNIWKEIVPATMQCHAATNHFWVSAVNSCTQFSSWPSFFVLPDGHLSGRLADHEPSVLVSTADANQEFFDAPGPWRERAMAGQLYSGELIDDPRSRDRTCL